eukprot:ANDGO_00936.mRNA.2 Eukaryotic translation initiation factor 5
MATVNIGNVSDEFYRYKMPVMKTQILSRGNGIKTWVVNVSDIAKALSRPPDYLIKFFGFELGAQTKWEAAAQKGIVNGEHTLETLNGLLAQFISKFVTCAACKNPETNIFLRGDTVRLECVACGNTTKVDPIERLCSYIKNHPPAENAKKKTTSVDKVGATPAAEENVEAIASVDVNVLANQIDSLQVQQKEVFIASLINLRFVFSTRSRPPSISISISISIFYFTIFTSIFEPFLTFILTKMIPD